MKTILGFGASTMQGAGDPAGGFFSRLPSHPLLSGLSLNFKNHGIGGNCLADMLLRMDKAGEAKPYDLILILGCNDLPRDRDSCPAKRSSLPEYCSRLRRLLETIRGERSLFVSSFAVSQEKTGVDPELFETYMTEAMGAATSAGYETWDLYRETRSEAAQWWAEDGLHFNGEGHALIADHVAPWIARTP